MQQGTMQTAGLTFGVTSHVGWLWRLINEGAAGALRDGDPADADVQVTITDDRKPFDVDGWDHFSRDAWCRAGRVVLRDVCTTGLDMCFAAGPDHLEVEARWRPELTRRALRRVMPSRFHLLVRAAVLQYPCLWWAGSRGRAPLHVSACTVGGLPVLFAGASGVGKSTLLHEAVARGDVAATDNLGASDGHELWGLVEPVRVEGANGRRMPHGRREDMLRRRVESLVPECVVVLRRGTGETVRMRRLRQDETVRWLVAGTYLAGELRRYWPFAGVLTLGTALGPAHPPVERVARALAGEVPCLQVTLPRVKGVDLTELIKTGVGG